MTTGRATPGGLSWEGELRERDHAVSLRVDRGRILALVGPNGAGKSTTLDLVAGVVRPSSGRLTVDAEVLYDSASGIDVPTHRRRIAVLGQDPLLFPHLRVLANVEFGPRAQGASRADARARASRMLAEVDAAAFARRYPDELSGGQAARVALARALATSPRALLLDEPFAALDVDVAPEMRRVLATELRRREIPTVLITHDILDVLALADDIAVVQGGRVVEAGPVSPVLAAPTSDFAASLAGVNLVRGRVTGRGRLDAAGFAVVGVGDVAVGDQAVAVWSPSAVAIDVDLPHGSPRNAWPGVVVDLADRGGAVRVRVDIGPAVVAADLSADAVAALRLDPGMSVHAVVKAQEVRLHPAR